MILQSCAPTRKRLTAGERCDSHTDRTIPLHKHNKPTTQTPKQSNESHQPVARGVTHFSTLEHPFAIRAHSRSSRPHSPRSQRRITTNPRQLTSRTHDWRLASRPGSFKKRISCDPGLRVAHDHSPRSQRHTEPNPRQPTSRTHANWSRPTSHVILSSSQKRVTTTDGKT